MKELLGLGQILARDLQWGTAEAAVWSSNLHRHRAPGQAGIVDRQPVFTPISIPAD